MACAVDQATSNQQGSRRAHQNHKTPSKESRNCAARTYPLALPFSRWLLVRPASYQPSTGLPDRLSDSSAPLSQLACSGAVSVSKRRRHQAVIAVVAEIRRDDTSTIQAGISDGVPRLLSAYRAFLRSGGSILRLPLQPLLGRAFSARQSRPTLCPKCLENPTLASF